MNRYRFERSPDGIIKISASRTISFILFLICCFLMGLLCYFLYNIYQARVFNIPELFLFGIAFLLILFFLIGSLKVALQGQIISINNLDQTISKNENTLARFDEVEKICIIESPGQSHNPNLSYSLTLLLKNGRKISIGKLTDKEKLFTFAQEIADLLKIPEPVEKNRWSDLEELAEKWIKRARMGPY